MNKLNLKNTEWTGVVTSFYCQYCYDKGAGDLPCDKQRQKAVRFFRRYFSKKGMNPHNLMTMEKIPFQGILNVAVRNRIIDSCVQCLVRDDPGRPIVNIGCGFDTRFFRLENYCGKYYDVDFYNVITAKKKILSISEERNYFLQPCNNAFSGRFIRHELDLDRADPIIICEGVFCYIPYLQVVNFVRDLFGRYPKATLICDVFLYQQHLVFSDMKSRLLLKYPEDGEKRYKRHEKWYRMMDHIRKRLTNSKVPATLKNETVLQEVYTPENEETVCLNGREYIPEYWIGIYERIKDCEHNCRQFGNWQNAE